jgi:hypothetical protein
MQSEKLLTDKTRGIYLCYNLDGRDVKIIKKHTILFVITRIIFLGLLLETVNPSLGGESPVLMSVAKWELLSTMSHFCLDLKTKDLWDSGKDINR